MHLSALILSLAAALPLACAAPEFVFIRSKSSVKQFNNLYLTLEDDPAFTFTHLNAAAYTFSLQPNTTASGPKLYYLNYNETSVEKGNSAELQVDNSEGAAWEPVFLVTAGTGNAVYQNRFFINGTGSAAQLTWKNDPEDEIFGQWLICTFSYLAPQLFFTQAYYPLKTLPSECGAATLSIIPVPNSS